MNNAGRMQVSRFCLAAGVMLVGALVVQPAHAIGAPPPCLPNIVIIFDLDKDISEATNLVVQQPVDRPQRQERTVAGSVIAE